MVFCMRAYTQEIKQQWRTTLKKPSVHIQTHTTGRPYPPVNSRSEGAGLQRVPHGPRQASLSHRAEYVQLPLFPQALKYRCQRWRNHRATPSWSMSSVASCFSSIKCYESWIESIATPLFKSIPCLKKNPQAFQIPDPNITSVVEWPLKIKYLSLQIPICSSSQLRLRIPSVDENRSTSTARHFLT